MRIPSDEIPQADNLIDVIRTVISVSQGARTFQDIANSIDKVERQGRYYRKAAEILGLIHTPERNHSLLTNVGKEFIRTGAVLNNPILIQLVLSIRLFQRLIPFLELNLVDGITRGEIVQFISEVSDLAGNSMAFRRLSSVISWLSELNLIETRDNRYFFKPSTVLNSVEIMKFTNVDEPILPRTSSLLEYQTVAARTVQASEIITTYRNNAALERADNTHRNLVNLVAEKIKNSNHIPRYNQLIDLATRIENNDFIFEMKSITPQNVRSQVRKGLSQLYEYQYLQNLPEANLVLVVEKALPEASKWMIDYLESFRNIKLIWDGDGKLYGTRATRTRFDFLDLH